MSIRRLRFNSVDPVSVIRLAILTIFCFGFITNADAVALQDDGANRARKLIRTLKKKVSYRNWLSSQTSKWSLRRRRKRN